MGPGALRRRGTERMNEVFDPYEQWLKIPPDRRPPSYYDLVGVPDDETDDRRIDDAATERMQRVRTRALGAEGEHVTRILNELSQALDCLTTPGRREAYDQKRLHEVVERWLESGRRPADFYELIGAHRFTPDRSHLLGTIRSARRYLERRSAGRAPAREHAADLLSELDDAQTALSGPSAFQQYHRQILARLWSDYVRQHGGDQNLWDLAQLREWLQQAGRVHPNRTEAIVYGMCDAKIEAWDQLLVELFPVGSAAGMRLSQPPLAELWDEEAFQPDTSDEPGPPSREPPELPLMPPDGKVVLGPEAERGRAKWARALARRAVRLAPWSVPGLVILGCVAAIALIVVAVSFTRRDPAPANTVYAPLDPEARRRLRETRFAEAIELLLEKPPRYQAALGRLQATCLEFPRLEGLEREYALSAWCCVNLGRWTQTWHCYSEARRRLGPAGPDASDDQNEVRNWLADVSGMVYLSTVPETRAVWSNMKRLEGELGGSLDPPDEFESLVELPSGPRLWTGQLIRLVVYQGEVHLLVALAEPGGGSGLVEAVTDRADFAEQICDYRSGNECGVADVVSVKGTRLPHAELSAESGSAPPAFRLQPEATLVRVHRLQRVGEPSSLAEVGRQLRSVFRQSPEIAGLAQYLQAPPRAGTGQTIQFDCFVSHFADIAATDSGSVAQTLHVTPHPRSRRSAEVRLTSETEVGVADVGKGDRVLIHAKVVGSGPDELVLEAVTIRALSETGTEEAAAEQPAPPVEEMAESDHGTDREAVREDMPQPEPSLAELLDGFEGELPAEGQPQPPPPDHVIQIQAHQGPIQAVSWSPDGNYLATAGDQTAKIWDPWTGRTIRTYGEHTPVTDLAWCPARTGRTEVLIAVASSDHNIRVFDVGTETHGPEYFDAESPVSCLTWSPDGESLAAGLASGELAVCNSAGAEGFQKCASGFSAISSIAWHPSLTRLLVLGDEEGLVWVWDLRRGKPAFGRIDANLDSFRGMISGNPELRDLLSSGLLRLVSRPAGRCYQLAWSPDGDQLAVAENGIEIWDFDPVDGLRWSRSLTEGATAPASGQNGSSNAPATFNTLAWHPGGRSLAGGTAGGRVIVFDVVTGGRVGEFRAPAEVGSVGWSRRGRHLAAGSADGTLTVWAFGR